MDLNTGKIIVEGDGDPFYLDKSPVETDIIEDFWSEDFTESKRYLELHTFSSFHNKSKIQEQDYYDMQVFIDNLDNLNLKECLQKIIAQNYSSDDALKQFLKIMKRKPERRQWLLFREGQEKKRSKDSFLIISSWLKSQGIELLID